MPPTRWRELADLPTNVNERIDRRALKERFAGSMPMPERPLAAEIADVFEQSLGTPAPEPDVDLVASGGLDSLSLVTRLFELEQVFAIQLPLETLDVKDFRTLNRIAGLVAASTGAGRPAA